MPAKKPLTAKQRLRLQKFADYTAIFHGCKNDNFQMKIFDIFLNFAQNIDRGYTLSTHNLWFRAKIRKIMYTPVNPNFTI